MLDVCSEENAWILHKNDSQQNYKLSIKNAAGLHLEDCCTSGVTNSLEKKNCTALLIEEEWILFIR